MARLTLNKSSLTQESRHLKAFQEFLPSLDLKRQQLMAEHSKARKLLADIRKQQEDLKPVIAKELPMLSDEQVDLTDIVKVTGVDLAEENIVGTRLPKLEQVHFKIRDYALLGKPHWVDHLVKQLQSALELQIQVQVAARRLALLDVAVRIISQRVNLFEKVLIPRTRANIKKIKIYLSDTERAAVVQAKIAKAKKKAAA